MEVTFRPLRENEAPDVLRWSQEEGWEVSKADVIRFINTQPGSFIAAQINQKCVGCITAYKWGERLGVVGFVLVKKEHRGQGIGKKLLAAAKEHLEWDTTRNVVLSAREHLTGMYGKVGFTIPSCDVIHYSGKPQADHLNTHGAEQYNIQHVKNISLSRLIEYDKSICPVSRKTYWEHVLKSKDMKGYVALKEENILGFGIIRPLPYGYCIAPLYADHKDIANILLKTLITSFKVVNVTVDTHGKSKNVMDLYTSLGLKEKYRLKRLCSQEDILFQPEKVWAIPDTDISIV